ncbi:MAG: hypothetical protein V1735_03620, partial [Nanoarchaeota archaeon]
MPSDISNRTLAILMLFAIVISLGGLYLSTNRLARIGGITGFASSGTGSVNVTIVSFNSIAIEDALINFGNCTPTAGTGDNLSSNESSEPACVTTGGTGSGVYPDNVSVSNDGNTNINVTVKTSNTGTFIGGTSPKFWYSSRNASVYGGCHNTSTNKCVDSASWCGCNTADDTNCTWRNQWT